MLFIAPPKRTNVIDIEVRENFFYFYFCWFLFTQPINGLLNIPVLMLLIIYLFFFNIFSLSH